MTDVLFSGQDQLPGLVSAGASYTVGALLLLLLCKGVAYAASLVAFRGGPTFPAIFLGAVGGIALSHLPGLPLVPAIAMGMGAIVRGDAAAAADLGPADDGDPGRRRGHRHAAGHRRRDRLVRGVGPAAPHDPPTTESAAGQTAAAPVPLPRPLAGDRPAAAADPP